jgi:hypothetical protein
VLTKLEILDTAVKVGLGALITGFTTYFIAKLNHDKTANKEKTERLRSLIESVGQQTAMFHQAALNHWSFVFNWIKFTPPDEEMSEDVIKELTRLNNEVLSAYKELTTARAKLSLLGEERCVEKLQHFGRFVNLFRNENVARRVYKPEELLTYKEELNKKADDFFSELSRIYKTY